MSSRRLKLWLQIALGLLLLGWLLHSVSWEQLVRTLAEADPIWVVGAFTAAFVQLGFSAWRWQVLLGVALGVRLPLRDLIRHYMISGFFNNFLPANIAGDVTRVGALFHQGHDKIGAAGSVVVERMLSLCGLILLAAWAVIYGGIPVQLSIPPLILAACAVAGVSGVVAIAFLLLRPPARLRPLIERVATAVRMYIDSPAEVALAMAITMVHHVVLMLITYCTFRAVGIDLSVQVNLAIYAIAALALTLPLTIQGVGVREGVYIGLLAVFGVSSEQVLAALALNYLVLVFFSLNGALLFWMSIREARSQIG